MSKLPFIALFLLGLVAVSKFGEAATNGSR